MRSHRCNGCQERLQTWFRRPFGFYPLLPQPGKPRVRFFGPGSWVVSVPQRAVLVDWRWTKATSSACSHCFGHQRITPRSHLSGGKNFWQCKVFDITGKGKPQPLERAAVDTGSGVAFARMVLYFTSNGNTRALQFNFIAEKRESDSESERERE